MKQILFLVVAVLFVYLGISTVFNDFHFVGKLGSTFGKYNRYYFGLLSYVYPFALLLPLWSIYRQKTFDRKNVSYIIMGSFILFFSLVILQALLLPMAYKGAFGRAIIDTLTPYIGSVGVWLLLIIFLAIAYIALFKDSFEGFITEKLQRDKVEETAKEKIEKKKVTKSQKRSEEKKEEKAHNETQSKEPKQKSKIVKKEENKENTTDCNVKIVQELEENKKLLEDIELGNGVEKPKGFRLPSIDFLQKAPKTKNEINEAEIDKKVKELIEKLKKFKIEGDVVRTYTGPLVTTFEFKPAPHIKVSKILNLADDLAMALKAQTIRIQAPIPGKDVVGIEIPNKEFQTIYLREIIQSDLFKKATSPLTLALGKDIVGKPFITDLKKLPHLLIAGTTGSGKSVGINAMVISLLYRNAPDRLKLMMIDPKMLEFSIYNDIPHLLTPVITSSKQAVVALSNMVGEMERRYQLMSQYKTKNIESFNKKAKKEGISELPYIVVIIDELADLMMTSGKDVEYSIARLAQMARASGIHLIVATQRPSVDVVTGLIKANLPARISFRVGQKIDSKVILDSIGAESLLGRGDMLFTPPGSAGLIRLHAPWISEQEIETIVQYLKEQQEPEYDEKFLAENLGSSDSSEGKVGSDDLDELFEEAKKIVLSERKTSISYLQRRLQIGYNRAARIVEQLENMGVLSPPNAKGNREILI
ncbi:FtsK/SpoIIIE family DNA translocase [Nitratiruptor sp. SB155-2]|uniref:FtsK/SpoIIIE family DNA translocase n=1 Tax=Nitratiruptor sp. (strain SB155-2) TaxID=387092 RepID=UPI0001586FC0|nr:DNA translocase FtsK [Nitratiruptor sp. SB155-2]BAF69938.1 cell division protein FtsK [Nitratiruptor sp. SB155-2]